ncbi:rhomboid-like protein [Streptomyces sp. NBC_01465]|uniref:rhomboid-like protein n=1 Tax=Streptomyces sp. NBC_01465 TaxID=2903878 RepID=UPI002E37C617|nr:rhomboid-like protein [Streptomyces sp. NBC_01465]
MIALTPAYVGGVQLGAYAAHRLLRAPARDRLLHACSTNAENLDAGRWDTLATSALMVEEPMELPYALLLLAVLGYAEYAYGAWWTAAVFALGHVGATLLVYGGLRAVRAPAGTRSALDVGVSYGFNAVLGALTGALPAGPVRSLARGALLAAAARPLLGRGRTFTDAGHFAALALGVGVSLLDYRSTGRPQ